MCVCVCVRVCVKHGGFPKGVLKETSYFVFEKTTKYIFGVVHEIFIIYLLYFYQHVSTSNFPAYKSILSKIHFKYQNENEIIVKEDSVCEQIWSRNTSAEIN